MTAEVVGNAIITAYASSGVSVSCEVTVESISIKDFAKEYVKVLNIWQNNVGTINRLSNWELAAADDSVSKDAELGANIDLSGKVAGGSLTGVTFGE